MRRLGSFGGVLCLAGAILALGAGAEAKAATVMGWGLNEDGQVGTGMASKASVLTPQPVTGLTGVTQVSAGREHTLALLANGTVMAWGSNAFGQLGDGTMTDRFTPAPVPGLGHVVAIAAGEVGGLALLADGTVKSWGDNFNGELGVGDQTGPEICPFEQGGHQAPHPCSTRPVTIPGLANVVAISGGGAFNVALTADGSVFAWGYDEKGALGTGADVPLNCGCLDKPTQVPGVSEVMAISAGVEFVMALRADGTVFTWGRNDFGALGTGDNDFASPTCLCLGPTSAKGVGRVKAIAAGGNFGLAVLAGGGATSWGFNGRGELANGVATPQTLERPCGCLPTPRVAGQLSGFSAIALGERHGLALLSDGGVASWGDNERGPLGIGTEDQDPHPTLNKLALTGVSAIAPGFEESFALVGPTRALSVSLAGAGKGTVGGSGLLCPPSCGGRLPAGQVAILRAEAARGEGFAGFSGACTGVRYCQAKLDRDRAVTATFGVPKGTRIATARIDSRHRSASFRAFAPGAITGYQCMLVKPRGNRKRKPRKPRFARCGARMIYHHLAPGRYAFKVRALDLIGPDAHPAVRRFKIAKAGSGRRVRG